MIRYSRVSDKAELHELLGMCFGDRDTFEPLEYLAGRYLLYIENGKIVAMTGLSTKTVLDGLEVDWTCTHPAYRGRGYMSALFDRLVNITDEDIYCSCWKTPDSEEVNMKKIMDNYGFLVVKENYKVSEGTHKYSFCNRQGCVEYKENCRCTEDLYLRQLEYEEEESVDLFD